MMAASFLFNFFLLLVVVVAALAELSEFHVIIIDPSGHRRRRVHL